MNCLNEEDIKFFELIFFDRYIDTGENDSVAFSIYPNRKSSEIKHKFNNVEILNKFMKTISKKLLKDCAEIPICNSILEDVDVVSLWRDRIWDIITFDNCLIKNTKKLV